MSALLDLAIEQVRTLPSERQEEIAKVILDMAEENEIYVLTPEEEASFAKAFADIEAGRTLSSEEAHALWSKLEA